TLHLMRIALPKVGLEDKPIKDDGVEKQAKGKLKEDAKLARSMHKAKAKESKMRDEIPQFEEGRRN
ncbi:hypothetical protein L0F63_000848, partial [Massospora cicadina]